MLHWYPVAFRHIHKVADIVFSDIGRCVSKTKLSALSWQSLAWTALKHDNKTVQGQSFIRAGERHGKAETILWNEHI
jgi:hypothetical protein